MLLHLLFENLYNISSDLRHNDALIGQIANSPALSTDSALPVLVGLGAFAVTYSLGSYGYKALVPYLPSYETVTNVVKGTVKVVAENTLWGLGEADKIITRNIQSWGNYPPYKAPPSIDESDSLGSELADDRLTTQLEKLRAFKATVRDPLVYPESTHEFVTIFCKKLDALLGIHMTPVEFYIHFTYALTFIAGVALQDGDLMERALREEFYMFYRTSF